ncbi:GNAT family N-acetyltransferase [Paenibacillus alkalitolerans]|uniref:GNAT family N-acetyltransferase n=1 Tax=Paenibacillus alkalitolerans TaxID=2799335 RepID=UPI001F3B62E0|nr:GNAT family N-acetyltransferase [Paenibacillus alkalitolerans]
MTVRLRFRPYADESDYTALRSIIIRKFADPKRRFYPSPGDLDYNRSFGGDAFLEKLTICETQGGVVIGAVWPGHYRILYCVTDLEHADLEDEIFDWAERRYSGPSLGDRAGEEVYIWGYPEDTVRSKILRDRGYTRHTWYMYSGVIDLKSAIPEPQIPNGYTVRPIQPADLPQKVAVMSGSAGLTEPNTEIYNRLMTSPTYEQELDLIVVDENDQVAGFANVWQDKQNNIAIIEPFGTAEAHRRKGLATNLLYDIMHRLKGRGSDKLYINHGGMWTLDTAPDDAMRVYNKVGFQELGKMFVWCKPCSHHDAQENTEADT